MSGLASSDRAMGRKRLLSDPYLGMGNLLWRAQDAYPDASRLAIPAEPFETAWGERCQDLSLRDWARLSLEYARRYAGLGVRRRDPVGVYCADGAKYLLHFFALTQLGAIAVFVNPGMTYAMAARYMDRVGVVGLFTDEARRSGLHSAASCDWGFSVVESDFRTVPTVQSAPYVHHDDDPVLITHSSGTTGVPKAVLLQHRRFFYPIARTLESPRDPATLRAVSALPPSHNSAVSAAAIAIMNGEELTLMSNLDGISVLRMIASRRPTSVVAFPQTYVDMLDADLSQYDLSSIQMWINLGDAAHEKHIRHLMKFGHHRLGKAFRPGSRFLDGLGSSEMGSMLFSIIHTPGDQIAGRCVGPPHPWVEAEILTTDGARASDDQPGFLAVKSPSVAAAYWNNSSLTYGSRLNGYFLTGDLAYRDGFGRFHHLDRSTDMVSTDQGPIYTLVYEEAILNSDESLLDCALIATRPSLGEANLVCFAVMRNGWTQKPDILRSRVDSVLVDRGLRPLDELHIVSRQELLVGVTGKVLKGQLREFLLRKREQHDGFVVSETGELPEGLKAPALSDGGVP